MRSILTGAASACCLAVLLAVSGAGCFCTVAVCGDGVCDPGETAACVDCAPAPYCGDAYCDPGEGCGDCPSDCGACTLCGNGLCDATEDCVTCATDCSCAVCGDSYCDPGENCVNCANDCLCGQCGDGVCDTTEDTTCADCTFETGESLCTSIGAADFLPSELLGAFGIYDTDVEAAFYLAKGTSYYFTNWCGTGCSSTFIGGYFNVVGSMTVRGVGDNLDYTDWVMVCEDPTGTLYANDDFDTAMCTGSGLCDPGMIITGSGLWTCLFAAAPFPSQNADPFGPICITTK